MSTPAPDPNETSRMKTILNARVDDSIKARLPRGSGGGQPPQPPVVYEQPYQEPPPRRQLSGFMPAFWTIASVLSMIVNVVLIALILILFQMVGALQSTANDQFSGLLGGLYQNFVKMEQATITSNIPVDANIPLNIMVPVQARNETITLSQPADIRGVQIDIVTPGFTLHARDARVILPAGTPLNVDFDLELPVQNSIPIHLDVPVNIPLRETQLREPFVGLQDVVEPWYCMVEPNALVMGEQICSPMNPEGTGVETP